MESALTTLLIIALGATLAVLLTGVLSMMRGGEFNKRWGNKLMRARVAMQALAIALLFALFLVNQNWGE